MSPESTLQGSSNETSMISPPTPVAMTVVRSAPTAGRYSSLGAIGSSAILAIFSSAAA